MDLVDEVLPFLPIEPLAHSHQSTGLLGVISVRGEIIPVLDAAEWLGLRRTIPAPEDPHILTLHIPLGKLIGFLVDEALELVEIPERSASWTPGDGPVGRIVECDGTLYRLLQPKFQ